MFLLHRATLLGMTDTRLSLDAPPSISGVKWAIAEIRSTLNEIRPHLKYGADQMISGIEQHLTIVSDAYFSLARARATTVLEQRFWAKVTTSAGHLIWTGMAPGGRPQCDWEANGAKVRTTPQRVAWLLLTNSEIPPGRNLKKLCPIERCIAPACYALEDTPRKTRMGRIRKDVMFIDNGAVVCARNQHPLKRYPRPGEKLYCPACHAMDVADRKRNDAMRLAISRRDSENEYTLAMAANGYPSRQSEEIAQPVSRRPGPTPEQRRRVAELFEKDEDAT